MAANRKRFFLPTEVSMGRGSIKVLTDILSPGERIFVVTDPGIEKAGITGAIISLVKEAGAHATVFNRVEPNPTSALVAEAMAELTAASADRVIAVGGGSSLDLGKIIAALASNDGKLEDYQWNGVPFKNDSIPFIAIPTTAGTGSEVTRVAVIADRNVKKGVNSDKLYPKTAIIDPELMTGLPSGLTASTGVDALSHAVEAYVGLNSNPFTDALALEAVKLIKRSLVRACKSGTDIEARGDMAMASTLAGVAMDQAGLGIVHSMAGPFSGVFHLPHGEANAVLLRYGMKFNLKAVSERFAVLAEALGCSTAGASTEEAGLMAVDTVGRIIDETGLKVDIKAYGLKESDAEMVAGETCKMFLLRNNPFSPTQEECRELYLEVFSGEKDKA